MRLSRIYVDQSLAVGSKVILNKDVSHYIRNVLRLKAAATISLFNGEDDCDYESRLEFEGRQTNAKVFTCKSYTSESPLDSEIIQGLSRSDHIDLSIQKCTELGVRGITIFNAQRSQIPLKTAQLEKRLSHWQAIAIKACEQCKRHKPPSINFFNRYEAALEYSVGRENRYLLSLDGPPLPELLLEGKNQAQLSLLIGPEGGLSTEEIALAGRKGFISAGIGPRVLRTETAAMAALTIVQSICGDLTSV